MGTFRKRPVEIEAVQFIGVDDRGPLFDELPPDWLEAAISAGLVRPHPVWPDSRLQVVTLEDDPTMPEKAQIAEKGDWIIQGVKGELYPCKPDIFEATYEAV